MNATGNNVPIIQQAVFYASSLEPATSIAFGGDLHRRHLRSSAGRDSHRQVHRRRGDRGRQ